LAKRQFTWLRGEEDALWLDSLNPDLRKYTLEYLEERGVLSNVSIVL
jgi:tRNA A37 N6-isopentenylltransferase MiaA